MKPTTKSDIDHYFNQFLSSIKNEPSEQFIKNNERDLKRIFKSTYAFSCYIGNGLPKKIDPILKILNEGSLALNYLFLEGYFNSGFALLRTIVEYALKAIYFSTHPVELSWTLNRTGYREISYSFLFEYLQKTDEFENLPSSKEILDRISLEYAELSRYVHCHNPAFSHFSVSNSKTGFNKLYEKAASKTHEVISVLVSILPVYFKKDWQKLPPRTLGIVLLGLKKNDKSSLLKTIASNP